MTALTANRALLAQAAVSPLPAFAPVPALYPDVFRSDVMRIETARLWLRWPEPGDAAPIAAFAREAAVAEMTSSWPHPLPDGEVERRIRAIRESNAAGTGLSYVICEKARRDHAIGLIGSRPNPSQDQQFGLGYMLSPAAWGRGLATEAVRAFTTLVLRVTGAGAMVAQVRTINPASSRVLLKAGFVETGTDVMDMPARGPAIPVIRYRLDERARRRA